LIPAGDDVTEPPPVPLLDTESWWMVVNVADAKWDVVSLHASRDAAETERDRRNRDLSEPRFSAFIAFEPVAERMGRPCG
jgi:hypothetical protein